MWLPFLLDDREYNHWCDTTIKKKSHPLFGGSNLRDPSKQTGNALERYQDIQYRLLSCIVLRKFHAQRSRVEHTQNGHRSAYVIIRRISCWYRRRSRFIHAVCRLFLSSDTRQYHDYLIDREYNNTFRKPHAPPLPLCLASNLKSE